MQKKRFVTIFIVTNLIFIFLQIHKHTQFIKYSFALQKNEKTYKDLLQQKEILTQKLYAIQNRSAIKKFAQRKLHMHPVAMHQIKHLASNSHDS